MATARSTRFVEGAAGGARIGLQPVVTQLKAWRAPSMRQLAQTRPMPRTSSQPARFHLYPDVGTESVNCLRCRRRTAPRRRDACFRGYRRRKPKLVARVRSSGTTFAAGRDATDELLESRRRSVHFWQAQSRESPEIRPNSSICAFVAERRGSSHDTPERLEFEV